MCLTRIVLLVVGISLTCRGDFGDHSCLFYGNEPGWRCSDGDCIVKDWVCDSHQQCVDNSDETLGCNLFNDTGCYSWQGRRHVKCPNSPNRCVENIESDCPQDETGHDDVSGSSCPDVSFWRCNDGLCIPSHKMCDGHRDCKDGSDETEGCQLYPSTLCQSWFGLRHIQCVANSSVICTLPEFELASNCRGCSEGPNKWRCDNGLCIDSKLVKNGIQDCNDGSDENTVLIKWWAILFITMAVSLLGILASYCYREACRRTHFFTCKLCQKKPKKTKQKKINHRSKPFTKDYLRSESLMSESQLNENILPLRLIELLDSEEHWRKKSLSGDSSATGKQMYAKVHQSSVLYQNLYQYLIYKHSRKEDLSRRIELLRRWELDFHGGDNQEVLKCWRLHLGMCDVLKHVVKSVEPPSILNQFYEKIVLPVRNAARRQRKDLNQGLRSKTERVYTFIKTTGLLVRPFLGASVLYFDICKDATFAYLIFKSLGDLTDNDYFNSAYAFEMALPCYFVVSIVMVQIFFAAISHSYATEIFELNCEHHSQEKRRWLRVFVLFFFWPLMPAFILANHVYFSEQEHSLRRDLETCDAKEDAGEGESICKTTLFLKIQYTRYRSQLHRRIYSFYRITHASIESMTLIVILILISIVCPRSNRKINLLEGVQSKIGDFLEITTQDYSEGSIPGKDETILSQLGLAKDVVFGLSITFSFVMVITAFARYIYQSKGKNVTFVGQIFLALYFAFHSVARLTVSIAMFSTAEAAENVEGVETESYNHSKPIISLLPSAVIAFTLFVFHFVSIYWLKFWMVPDFRLANKIEQLVHVLANTVVVIPFMNWDVGIRHSFEENPNDFGEENCDCLLKRSASVNALDNQNHFKEKKTHRRAASDLTGITVSTLCRVNSRPGSKIVLNENHSTDAVTEVDRVVLKFPQNASSLQDPIKSHFEFSDFSVVFADVKGKIVRKWWDDPSRDLSEEEILSEFSKFNLQEKGVVKIYRGLVNKGFINRDLFNPLRTKSEFFWLLIFQFLVNSTALVIEVVNGGVQTAKGMYFSWDVRLGSFFLGIVFLALYYRKYHMLSELTGHRWCGFCWNFFPVYFCCKKDKPMQAIPMHEEIERCLEQITIRKTVETQTSIVQAVSPHTPTRASDNVDQSGDKVKVNKGKPFELNLFSKGKPNPEISSAKTSPKDRQVTLV